MNTLLVRLSQSHYKNAMVLFVAMFDKALVGRDEHLPLGLHKRPQLIIENPLAFCATDVENIVPSVS